LPLRSPRAPHRVTTPQPAWTMRNRVTSPTRALAMLAALLLTAALVPSAVTSASAAPTIKPSGSWHGSFQVSCRSSHQNFDDPIVYPGKVGAAHHHDFFGNRTTNAFSKRKNLIGKKTTCSRPGDTAAYWVPALYNNGKRVKPDRLIAYYRTTRIKDVKKIKPFPKGLRMIAGDHMATRRNPQSTEFVNWRCGDGISGTATPPARCGGLLRLRVEFPNCWDGRNLDSANHKSHMTYSRSGGRGCPSSHPVAVPSLHLNFKWKVRGSLSGVKLASGGVHSGHADFFNAWKQKAQKRLVRRCLNSSMVCGSTLNDAPK
jgi:Domain of unknown function (DUF1996)